jgi:TonB-dependent receptor
MRTILLIGTAALAVAHTQCAAAQTAPSPSRGEAQNSAGLAEDEPASTEIVVTGIVRSLADAAEIKRKSDSVVDVIAAEDIAKFPDQNIAESLQRVPGVQIDRNKGEGASVSVRGLGSNFTSTFYNGRVIPSPAGGRDFSFTSLGSDFVRTLEVIKTPTADLLDGGLAAAINVKVTRPLDVGRNRTSLSLEGIYEENPDKFSPHVSFYANRILIPGTLGVSLGVDYKERSVIQAGFNSWGLERKTETRALDYDRNGTVGGPYRLHHALALWSDEGEFRRLNIVGGVQFRPAPNVDLYVDGLYSRFVDDYIRYEHQIRFTNIGTSAARIHGSEITSDGIITYLDADGVDNRAGGRDTYVEDTTYSIAAGGNARFGALTLSAEGSYSRARRLNSFVQLSMITRARASYDFRDDMGSIPKVSFNRGYDPFDPAPYSLFAINGELESPTRDSNQDLRFDASYDVSGSLLTRIKAGVYVAEAQKSYYFNRYTFSPQLTATMLGLPYTTTEGGSVPATTLVRVEDYSKYVGEQIGHYLAPDRDKVFANVSLEDFLARSPTYTDQTQNYVVNEKTVAAYGRLDFSSPDESWSANLGLRYTRTRLSSEGAAPDFAQVIIQNDGSTIVPAATAVAVRNDYEYWLPSFNFRWEVAPDFQVRLALNRAITRPDLGILTPRTSINGLQRTISSQNPNVKPYLANQADLSFEYYLGRAGILSAAFFYKDVENFIITRETTETHTVRLESGGTETLTFRRTAPANGTDATVKGVELAAQIPFTFLPGPLQGLGFSGNVTFLDTSDVKTSENGAPVPVTGVSKRSFTVGGYFEHDGFGLRANYNWRSRYVVSQLANFGDGQFTEPYGQLDVSGSYAFSRNLSLRIDASNLTHAIQRRTNNIGLLRNTYDYGRRFSAAVRLRF